MTIQYAYWEVKNKTPAEEEFDNFLAQYPGLYRSQQEAENAIIGPPQFSSVVCALFRSTIDPTKTFTYCRVISDQFGACNQENNALLAANQSGSQLTWLHSNILQAGAAIDSYGGVNPRSVYGVIPILRVCSYFSTYQYTNYRIGLLGQPGVIQI